MSVQETNKFDETGKCVLDQIYDKSDPRPYFSTLGRLKYLIPQFAKPVFRNVLDAYMEVKDTTSAKVVDLGCSYGVNAALLKCDMDMQDLYGLYGTPDVEDLDRDRLMERDRRIFAHHNGYGSIEVVGMDAAPKAVTYAEEVEIIDDKIVANLERESLKPQDQDCLEDTDLVISTGCIGYISEKTICKIVDANHTKRPWMAHFVLRMFSFEPIKEALAKRGYVTARGPKPVPQRLFASSREREQVLDRLMAMGVDPSGYETDGWYYADLFVSRPVGDISTVPSSKLTAV